MSYSVIPIPPFEKELKRLYKKYPSVKQDLAKLNRLLEKEPRQGESLGNNNYKIRVSVTSKGKGKSGGARVITHIHVTKETVYLLSIYDKSEQENISNEQLKEKLKFILP
ncbi:MAG: type II toxin-antitoxin system RelE/ParE family toxin [Chitinophagales bacterium]|nr:type II toxin-antitoxin system RelE/ParE family toxin [Chitinophagales bacterium]